ncbi:MAG: type II secretion system protein GspD [Bryobacteraceae bacterium]
MLYHRAAALAPDRTKYWLKAQAIRGRAALQTKFVLPTSTPPSRPPVSLTSATPADFVEARKPQPPKELKAKPIVAEFLIKGTARSLFEQVSKTYGLDVVFDGDYPQTGPQYPFQLDSADYRTALYALQSVTGSFAFPLGERLLMVAKDSVQKRNDLEPYVSLTIPIPTAVTIQEAQELARSVQQALEIRRFAIDSGRRIVVIRDAISKAYPALELFEDLLLYRAEVELELEFIEVTSSDTRRLGLTLPTQFPISAIAPGGSFIPSPGYFLKFGGGMTVFGVLIGDGSFIASESRSRGATLLRAKLRSTDGQAATFHVGDRYPVLTGGYFGPQEFSEGGQVFTPPPQVSFEDLGLNIKITPRVTGSTDVAMEIEAEFKVLAGAALNGIPVIANRKANANTRLRVGQWAVIAGMMSVNEARSLTGIAGLSQIPGLGALLRHNERTKEQKELLILIKPRISSMPASEFVTRFHWVGPEGRLRIPL